MPWRRMMRHFSHRLDTEAETFMSVSFNPQAVPQRSATALFFRPDVTPVLACIMFVYLKNPFAYPGITGLWYGFSTAHADSACLPTHAANVYCTIDASCRVKISGSPSVIATVCSKCADHDPSADTTVHSSSKTAVSLPPVVSIGSIAKVIPFLRRHPRPGSPWLGMCGSSHISRPIP